MLRIERYTGDQSMGIYLYIATAIGLFIVTQTDGQWNIVKHTLKNQSLTSIAVTEGVILAGTRDGIWRSTDNGRSWNESNTNLAIRYVRWLASSSKPSAVFLAGTEPAGIFISRDGRNQPYRSRNMPTSGFGFHVRPPSREIKMPAGSVPARTAADGFDDDASHRT